MKEIKSIKDIEELDDETLLEKEFSKKILKEFPESIEIYKKRDLLGKINIASLPYHIYKGLVYEVIDKYRDY